MKIRDRNITIGKFQTGENNCITDVQDVSVGHVTLDYPIGDEEKEYACTGVTAILPHSGNFFKEKVPAASYVINGFGKTTGLVQVNELGHLESPIMLTNTFSVPAVTEGTLKYMLEDNKDIGESTGTINIVVGECNDSYLNSIRQMQLKPAHALEAIEKASNDPALEGAIGAGKGMVCFGYKGGIGTSSRKVENGDVEYTIGTLVLSNFGKKEDFSYHFLKEDEGEINETSDGSIMIVVATDAPLSDRQLLRISKRCSVGLARTGSHYSHGSGDIVIAFSTLNKTLHNSEGTYEETIQLREDKSIMNDLFAAVAEATEEAILNSLSQAETTTGKHGRIVRSFPFKK
ncbi:P1 family peptidase [Bacillus shivajii]|uniref:P1 family peptidase n=1 Tax=Bacillus shivajii TaxID=1983719 RepID=UPI001CFB0292|nr:P1 family peptidase [Bacillus shivajii]UCZ51393.1 P1 family peptidase [Bacillus shivajii]